MEGENTSLESTPTWAVAGVSSGLILVALFIEHSLHLLTRYVQRRKRKSLNQALSQIKAELRKLGFISLLMTMAKQPITKICISRSLGDSFLPCKDIEMPTASKNQDTCARQGKVSLVSGKGMEQLQVLVFVLAVFHVFSCLLTLFLGEAKINRWKSWEEETQTLEHQLSHDSRRLKLTQQTSFAKRHMKWWSNYDLLLWIVCFQRQLVDSISRADYFALRHGFISAHLSKNSKFDFHKFLRRSLDHDFVMVFRISASIWIYATIFILFNAHGFYAYYWLPIIPLVILLIIGMKLQRVITMICIVNNQVVVVPGGIDVKTDSNLFWFKRPQLLLHHIHFVLVQNSFQLAFLAWTRYKFGFRSCFHHEAVDIVLNVVIGLLVQFLCAYVTLPLYALVSQMGSSMKETIFTESIVDGLKNWNRIARKNLLLNTSTPPSPPSKSVSRLESISTSSNVHSMRIPESIYPSERRELEEMQKVAEERIECSKNNIPYDGEISFQLWRK